MPKGVAAANRNSVGRDDLVRLSVERAGMRPVKHKLTCLSKLVQASLYSALDSISIRTMLSVIIIGSYGQ